MKDRPIAPLDPARLQAERHDVDFGSVDETNHNHIGHDPGQAPADKTDPIQHPTSGSIPPAR